MPDAPGHRRPARGRDRSRDRSPPPERLLDAPSATFNYERAPDGRAVDRRQRRRPHRRGAGGLPGAPTRCCWARVGGPDGTRRTPPSRAPSRACSACARAWASTRTCARCGPSPALMGASPLREDRIAGTDLLVVRELDRRHLLRRKSGREGDAAFDTCEYDGRRDRADRPRRLRGARRAPQAAQPVTSVDKANVLETSRLWREVVDGSPPTTRRRARAPAGRQRGDAAGLPPRRLRRARHREPLRRHPQRRGGDAHRHRSGCSRRASLGADRRPGPLRAGARLGARHRRPGHRQPAGDLPLGGDDAAPRPRHARARRPRIEAAVDKALEDGSAHPEACRGPAAPPPMVDVPPEVEVGTAEMTAAVIEALARD